MTQAEARNIIKTCIAPNAVGLYNAGDIIMVQHVMAHFDRNPYEVLNEMNSKYPERFATNARDLLNGEQIDIGGIEIPRKQRKHWLF